jgi:tol-pal system protein YbgF
MHVTCESCKTSFELNDSEISDKETKVRCSECGYVFVVSGKNPDDMHSEFEIELKDIERFQRDQTESEAPAGEETPSFSGEESGGIPEDSRGVSFQEFMEKEGQSLESRQSEPPISEDLDSTELNPFDEDLLDERGAEENDFQPSPPSESSKDRGMGEGEGPGKSRGIIILCLISAVVGGIVTALLIVFLMTLSGGNFWLRGSSQSAEIELLENRLNSQISLLEGRYEELEGRITHALRGYEDFDAWTSQAAKRIGELEGKLATSQKDSLPEHEAKKVSMKEAEKTPRDDSGTRPAGDARTVYQNAYQSYEKRDYRGAIAGFQQFVQTHPSDELADNALYWIGESYYSQGGFREAITSFMKVVAQYPGGNKAADALLKIGFSYGNLNEEQKAREFLTQVMNKYPSTEAAGKAELKLESMSQP